MSLWNSAETSANDRKSSVPLTQPTPERQETAPAAKPAAEVPVAPTPAPGGDLLLGRGARFEGKLTFEGVVRIDARFIGSVGSVLKPKTFWPSRQPPRAHTST